jgi:hypothetical protein
MTTCDDLQPFIAHQLKRRWEPLASQQPEFKPSAKQQNSGAGYIT